MCCRKVYIVIITSYYMKGINLRMSDRENKKVEEFKVKFRLNNKEDTIRKMIRDFKIKEDPQ